MTGSRQRSCPGRRRYDALRWPRHPARHSFWTRTMTNPASPAPEVAVRKLVLSVEEVWHDNGPPLATPLLRGSAAAVLKNPYAGRYVADIVPMMEALKPLG